MARHLHLDPLSGASGDMFLGLLVHLGLDRSALSDLPRRLGLSGVAVRCETARRSSLACGRVTVETGPDGPALSHGRKLADALEIVARCDLPARAAERARRALRALFEAEAEVHAEPVESVHLHEAAADDALIDIVGTAAGLEALDVASASCSVPVPLGGGNVTAAHGRLPVPAPAVALLLRGVPVIGGPLERELVTPTGAALLRAVVDEFGPMPALSVEAAGFGAGAFDVPGHANVLRGLIGKRVTGHTDRMLSVLECAIDDMLPQDLPPLTERLLEMGARDAFLEQILMKKGRPGVRLTAVCDPGLEREITRVLLEESTTLGVRRRKETRSELERETVSVETPWGAVRVKRALDSQGRIVRSMPEFEDCREAAHRGGVTIERVRRAAREAEEKRGG
jgi:uncharacterized protein (TIGR00299 family) protein